MAVTQSITIHRGEEKQLNFTMDPVPGGGIAGWTILFTISKVANSPVKYLSRAATILDAPAGRFQVALDADDTKDLKPGTYFYDVWRTDADEENVLALGPFTLQPVARLPL